MNECDIKHEERLRRYRLEVRYHPEWGAAVVCARGVGRDVPGVHELATAAQWLSGRREISARLMARAEAALHALPEPQGGTPWTAGDVMRAALWAALIGVWFVPLMLAKSVLARGRRSVCKIVVSMAKRFQGGLRMKRFLGVLVMLAVLFAQPASAKRLTYDFVRWEKDDLADINQPGDTLYTCLKIGTTDTTATISTYGWAIPDPCVGDSVMVAQLIISPDSTVAGTLTATALTLAWDGSIGTQARTLAANWQTIASQTVTVPAGDKVIRVPIFYNNLNQLATGANVNNGWGMFYPSLRCRIVAVGGVMSGSIRIVLARLVD